MFVYLCVSVYVYIYIYIIELYTHVLVVYVIAFRGVQVSRTHASCPTTLCSRRSEPLPPSGFRELRHPRLNPLYTWTMHVPGTEVFSLTLNPKIKIPQNNKPGA